MNMSTKKKSLKWLTEISVAGHSSGYCLATEYVNSKTKYLFGDGSCGHEWMMKANDVDQGHWCPTCGYKRGGISKRHDISWLTEISSTEGHPSGYCKSTKYIGSKAKYLFGDKVCGHEWMGTANDVYMGYWCPVCGGTGKKTLESCKALAISRGGACLSDSYLNSRESMLWACSVNHRWKATYHSIQSGSWCPTCSGMRSNKELVVLDWVRVLYPDAVGSVNGLLESRGLELDIYIPSLKKAIEFDGFHWHHSDWALSKGQGERDSRKNAQCVEAGIKLMRVNEADFDTDPTAVMNTIYSFLRSVQ